MSGSLGGEWRGGGCDGMRDRPGALGTYGTVNGLDINAVFMPGELWDSRGAGPAWVSAPGRCFWQ